MFTALPSSIPWSQSPKNEGVKGIALPNLCSPSRAFLPGAAFRRAELKVEQGRKGMSNPPCFLLFLSPVYTGVSGALSTVLPPWYPVPCTEGAPT